MLRGTCRCMDEQTLWAENKCRNINDNNNNNNKFPTLNDMLLLFTPFSAKWKIAKVWGKFCIFFAFGFIKENCLIKLSWLYIDIMSYTIRN